jgi:organic hydroperoxide reductase OsmC/OhrA
VVFGFFEAYRFTMRAADSGGRRIVAAGAKAQTICPYSKANRENIEVKLLANGKPVERNNQ